MAAALAMGGWCTDHTLQQAIRRGMDDNVAMSASYASGLACANRASPELASQAVIHALNKLAGTRASTVLLFLSADFAHDPRPALLAAARTAQTLNIAGCTALGVMTEDDWLLDRPAAAAMVITESSLHAFDQHAATLTLAAPNTIDLGWLAGGSKRFGAIAGDATGVGPFKVWRQGKLADDGRCELAIAANEIVVSQAIAPVGPNHIISSVDGFDLQTLDGRMASATLRRTIEPLPSLQHLALAVLDAHGEMDQCIPIVALNDDGSVTIASRLTLGQSVVWAQRTAATALDEVRHIARQAAPVAALMFSCAGRGSSMHQGLDQEWQILRRAWPQTALAGFYGNGQIASLGNRNQLLHQSIVLARLG